MLGGKKKCFSNTKAVLETTTHDFFSVKSQSASWFSENVDFCQNRKLKSTSQPKHSADRRSWTAHMSILFIFQFISKLTTEMLSTQSLISFVASVSNHLAQGNVQTVSKYLKFNPSSPARCSYFASQPYISFFTSLCAPLCLAKPPLWPLVTVLWVIVSALGCLSNVRDSEGQSEASNLPHRLSPSKWSPL